VILDDYQKSLIINVLIYTNNDIRILSRNIMILEDQKYVNFGVVAFLHMRSGFNSVVGISHILCMSWNSNLGYSIYSL
jgi:hypothetical protein